MNMSASCPLLSKAGEKRGCIGKDCAWFDDVQCIVFSLKEGITNITNNTSYIYLQDVSDEVQHIARVVDEINKK